MEYYASSRDGLIDKLPTTHSVLNMWYKFEGYLNRITKSKFNKQVSSDVAAICSQNFFALYNFH
jgi:gamma-glutamyl:cysteine ligase YbdK (ATP-grasp superfamily)